MASSEVTHEGQMLNVYSDYRDRMLTFPYSIRFGPRHMNTLGKKGTQFVQCQKYNVRFTGRTPTRNKHTNAKDNEDIVRARESQLRHTNSTDCVSIL